MKKLICILLTLIVALSLVGCGKKEDPNTEGKTVLTVWAHNDEDAWTNAFDKLASDFMALNEDIVIEFERFPYDEFESKVLTSLTSKSGGADVYLLWGGWGVDYASTGALAALPTEIADEIREESYPSCYGAVEYEGDIYALPLEFNIESGAMLVNQNILKEYGFETAKTWDELVEQSKKMAVEENGLLTQKGFDFVNWDGVPYLFLSMILSQGGQYLNEDGTMTFTTAEAKKAFEELANLVTVDKVTNLEGLIDDSGLEGYQQLYAGMSAYVPRGPWTINEGVTAEEDGGFGLTYGEDFTYEALPFYGDKVAFAAENGWTLAVNNASLNQDAAFKFLSYVYQDEVLMELEMSCGLIPAKKTFAQSEEYLEGFPYAAPLVGILDNAQFIGLFNTDSFKEIINNVFTDYCTGGIYGSLEEALQDLEAQVNEL